MGLGCGRQARGAQQPSAQVFHGADVAQTQRQRDARIDQGLLRQARGLVAGVRQLQAGQRFFVFVQKTQQATPTCQIGLLLQFGGAERGAAGGQTAGITLLPKAGRSLCRRAAVGRWRSSGHGGRIIAHQGVWAAAPLWANRGGVGQTITAWFSSPGRRHKSPTHLTWRIS